MGTYSTSSRSASRVGYIEEANRGGPGFWSLKNEG
jgi:hypothetical protein